MDNFNDPSLTAPTWPNGTVALRCDSLLTNLTEACNTDEINLPGFVARPSNYSWRSKTPAPIFGTAQMQKSNAASLIYGDSSDVDLASGLGTEHASTTVPFETVIADSNIQVLSTLPDTFAHVQSVGSASTLWPSFGDLSPVHEQRESQAFNLQQLQCEDTLKEAFIMDNLPSVSLQDFCDFQNQQLLSVLAAEKSITDTCFLDQQKAEPDALFDFDPFLHAGLLQNSQQYSHFTDGNIGSQFSDGMNEYQVPADATNRNDCNGSVKTRTRARRGQATDPHSIAERLRRERISERMKNLQELVPNSNKTDKASMLDEIIDYVKFLQLQVKVLSISRLGGADAVAPLVTESLPEGSDSLILSSSSSSNRTSEQNQSEIDMSVFEKEIVKMMESNVTSAMQYLQRRGLCLMPISLASAISNQKGSSDAAVPPAKRTTGFAGKRNSPAQCSQGSASSSVFDNGIKDFKDVRGKKEDMCSKI